MQRILLQQNATFHCHPSGFSEDVGDGTLNLPFRSPRVAFEHLAQRYDLGGRQVTVQLADGTYSSDSAQLEGLLVGQKGASALRFIGNRSAPSVVLRPPTGYALSVDQGAQCTLAGVKTYMMDSDGGGAPGTGQDALVAGALSLLVLDGDITFGANINPWNCMTAPGGQIRLNSGPTGQPKIYKIAPGLITTQWTTAAGFPNAITVPLAIAAQLRPYMGVNGPYMSSNPSCYVVSVNAQTGVVQLSTSVASGSGSTQAVNFSFGAQCFAHAGEGGTFQFVTNGEPNRMTIEFQHLPHIHAAGFYASQGSRIDVQGVTWVSGFHGKRFDVRSNSTIDVNASQIQNPLTYVPGTVPGTADVASFGAYI